MWILGHFNVGLDYGVQNAFRLWNCWICSHTFMSMKSVILWRNCPVWINYARNVIRLEMQSEYAFLDSTGLMKGNEKCLRLLRSLASSLSKDTYKPTADTETKRTYHLFCLCFCFCTGVVLLVRCIMSQQRLEYEKLV